MKSTWRRRSAQALYEQHHGPNMTPMVDVVMVILIFFMASTAFLGPEWFLRTALPVQAAGAPAAEPTRLTVMLTPGDSGATVASVGVFSGLSMAELDAKITEDALRTGPEDLVVLISPAPSVPYDDVVRVHETCARVGIIKVGLVE
jgi:biopolymer transport protein ExbD